MIQCRAVIITILVPVILLLPARLFSQAVNGNEIQQRISVALIGHTTTDGLLSLKQANANGIKFNYGISVTTIRRKTVFNIAYEKERFKTNGTTMLQHGFSFTLSDGFNIIPKANHFSAYAGYSVSSDPSFTTGKNIYSWNSSSQLSFYQSYEYKIKKQMIALTVNIPLAGAVYRPKQPATSGEKDFNKVVSTFYSNPSFSYLENYKAIDISAIYKINISHHLDMGLQYSFGYKKWTGTGEFKDTWHGLGLFLLYKSFH